MLDLMDETRAYMRLYAAAGRLPEMPDRELLPRGPAIGPAEWYRRLTPEEARRLADAINRA